MFISKIVKYLHRWSMIFQMFCNVFFFLYMALERLSTFLKGRGMWLTKSLLLFQIMNQNILPLPLTLKEYQGVLIVFVDICKCSILIYSLSFCNYQTQGKYGIRVLSSNSFKIVAFITIILFLLFLNLKCEFPFYGISLIIGYA